MHTSKQTTTSTPKRRRTCGSITSLRTPRKRSEDQRTNLRRSYQAFMRKLEAGEPVSSTHQSWPRRPYAASA